MNINVMEELTCLKDVLTALPYGIYWKDKDGMYLGCNKAQEKYWRGLTSDDIKGKTDDELYFRKRAKIIRESDHKVMQDKVPQMKEETIRTSGKDNQYFLTQKLPLINDKGEICGIVSMTQDVSAERKYLKDQAVQYHAHDLHSVKMGLSALQISLESLMNKSK